MVNIRLNTKRSNPSLSHLYRKYDDINLDHCKLLLVHLYGGKGGSWVNPLTGNNINNGSYVIISFLSKCYYVWGAKSATINSIKLKYKKHIEKFIAKEYLFDIPLYMQHIRGGVGSPVGSPNAIDPKYLNLQQMIGNTTYLYPSPPKSPMGVAKKSKSPPLPKSPSPPPPSYEEASSIKSKLNFTEKNVEISSKISIDFDMTKENCETLLNNIRKALGSNAKYIPDPLNETKTINIESPKLLLYLSKCYYTFDSAIKNGVKEIVDTNQLINIDEITAKQKRTNKTPEVQAKLANYEIMFNEYCDALIANCNADGILSNHKYISDIVNAILIIIYTKFLHLEYLYDDINNETFKNHLRIYMSNNDSDSKLTNKILKNNYNDDNIIYQKNDLMQYVNNKQTDLEPNTIERYYENTLLNRQYVFEIFKKLPDNAGGSTKYTDPTIHYNKINTFDRFASSFKTLFFPVTLEYAETQITRTPFNYNITNSVLPKHIEIDGMSSITKYFKEDIEKIQQKLATLPRITGINTELTKKHDYYEGVITDMKINNFGDNDIIRKNILYSLNAQTPAYIQANYFTFKDEIYYNSKFTGTFPIFTWIPISKEDKSIYNFPNIKKWQPFGHSKNDLFKDVGTAYKNYGIKPFSKSLNETIYKVITGEYSSIHSIDDESEQGKMERRINETLGAYKDLNKDGGYTNNKIYLYHGTNTKLHNMKDRENDIEILGYLSTTLNINTASVYSDIGVNGKGFIYIIEVDNEKTYINLNDHLHQFILLPHSIIRVVQEFNFGDIIIVLCSLIETPTIKQNDDLYNKLLTDTRLPETNVVVNYTIKVNNNPVPICASFRSDDTFKKTQQLTWSISGVRNFCITKISNEYIDIFQIPREWLAGATLPLDKGNKYELYVYFSLLQENDLHIRGRPKMLETPSVVVNGGFADISYSIHQHFIKDCYKHLEIPCIDYVFLHGERGNEISTGILLDDYTSNRKYEYKYDINNLLIDCIFNFDSINNKNKKLDLPDVDNGADVSILLYADKIEGFMNAGLYINGKINPDFSYNEEEERDYIFNYVKRYKNIFSKYRDADDENLIRHFKCYNAKLIRLMGIIDYLKDQYLNFINEILKPNPPSGNSSKNELKQLKDMLIKLADTLRLRAFYHLKLTRDADNGVLIGLIRKAFSEESARDNIPVPKGAVITDLKLCDDDDGQLGGKYDAKNKVGKSMVVSSFVDKLGMKGMKGMKEKGAQKSSGTKHEKERLRLIEETNHKIKEKIRNVLIEMKGKGSRKSLGTKREYANNEINTSISYHKSVYKFKDLPKDFQEYYGKQNNDTEIDISNSCHIRLVPRSLRD